MWSAPYPKRVLLLTLLGAATITLGDFAFKSVVAQTVPRERLVAYLSTVSLLLSSLSLLAQRALGKAAPRVREQAQGSRGITRPQALARLTALKAEHRAGAVIGLKVGTSLAVGALVNYGIVGPWLVDHEVLRVAPTEIASSAEAYKQFAAAASALHALPMKSEMALAATLRSKWSVWPGR